MSNATIYFPLIPNDDCVEELHQDLNDKLIKGFRDLEFEKIHFNNEPKDKEE